MSTDLTQPRRPDRGAVGRRRAPADAAGRHGSPVLAGSGVAAWAGGFSPVAALLALAGQPGPAGRGQLRQRLLRRGARHRCRTGGTAAPGRLRSGRAPVGEAGRLRRASGSPRAAGLVLVVLTGSWWLLIVGAACVLAAWYYTGGKRPYGYRGLGEVFVFVFFGLVAVSGTVLVQVGAVPWPTWPVAVGIGSLACSILVANNLRDLRGDLAVGKRTLATRLGDRGTRWFYVALVGLAGGGGRRGRGRDHLVGAARAGRDRAARPRRPPGPRRRPGSGADRRAEVQRHRRARRTRSGWRSASCSPDQRPPPDRSLGFAAVAARRSTTRARGRVASGQAVRGG